MKQNETGAQPRKWLLILLSLLSPILGFLYLGKGRLALIYLLIVTSMEVLANIYTGEVTLLNYSGIMIHIIGFIHVVYQGFQPVNQSWQRFHIWLKGVFIFCLVWAALRLFVFDVYRLPADSMAPSYDKGHLILMKRWGLGVFNRYLNKSYDVKSLQPGDVIVFDSPVDPSISYVKRVIALPNDRISFVQGQVIINGKPLPLESVAQQASSQQYSIFKENNLGHSYLIQRDFTHGVTDYPHMQNCPLSQGNHQCTVPENTVFVMGDNREMSSDSRYWGYVTSEQILGKVIWSNSK